MTASNEDQKSTLGLNRERILRLASEVGKDPELPPMSAEAAEDMLRMMGLWERR